MTDQDKELLALGIKEKLYMLEREFDKITKDLFIEAEDRSIERLLELRLEYNVLKSRLEKLEPKNEIKF